MQGIIGFRHYSLEFQQARPKNFVEVVMLFVRANVECKLIRWPITIERALIRVSICRSANRRLNANARSRLQLRTGDTR
jgi:hypothetical protein